MPADWSPYDPAPGPLASDAVTRCACTHCEYARGIAAYLGEPITRAAERYQLAADLDPEGDKAPHYRHLAASLALEASDG